MPSENRFNTVVILDSIPVTDLNTAKRLFDDLRDVAYAYSPIPAIGYYRVESSVALKHAIEELCDLTEHGKILPLLHIEAHGCEEGLALATGEEVSWANLKKMLIPLNIATQLNLMLVLASCSGGTFIKALRLADRAPIWGLIGPTQSLTANQVQVDFGAFYKTLFQTLSPSQALISLNSNAPTNLYYRTTAEGFFYEVWRGYRNKQCTREQLEVRARRMYKEAKRENMNPLPSIGHLRRSLVGPLEHDAFNKFRDTYFMYDIFPENVQRFQVTYEDAQTFAKKGSI